MFLSWKEIEVQLCSLLWFHANFDPMTFTLTSCGGTQKSWWSFPPPPCHSVNLSNMYPFSSSCIFSADKIRSVQGGKNWSHMVPGNRILTRSVKCNLFELDVDSAQIYLDLGSEVYNGYPQGCPPPHLLNIGLTISLGAFDLYACRSACCGLTNCRHLLLTAVSHRHSHCLLPLLWSFLHLCLSPHPPFGAGLPIRSQTHAHLFSWPFMYGVS